MRTLVLALGLLTATLTGCGTEPDLTGLFRVELLSRDGNGCGDGERIEGPSHFLVRRQESAARQFLTVQPCGSDDAASCSTLGLLTDYDLSEPEGSGYRGRKTVTARVEGGCLLRVTETRAAYAAGETLEVETRLLERLVEGDESCAEASRTADALEGQDLDCVVREVLQGRRIGDVPRLSSMTAFFN